jgi:hypothetical protein
MGRTYEIKDKKYPSVTSILSEYGNPSGLIQWSANCVAEYVKDHLKDIRDGKITADDIDLERARQYYKEKSGEALDIGSAVHDFIEEWIKYKLGLRKDDDTHKMLDDIQYIQSVQAFLKWVKDNNFIPYASEMTVYSHKHRYAGTLDCLARVNGKIYVVDFKTSKSHSPINSVQISAYRKALVEMNTDLPTPEGCAVLRLDKLTGLPDWKDYSKEYVRHFKTFKHWLAGWYSFKNRRCG